MIQVREYISAKRIATDFILADDKSKEDGEVTEVVNGSTDRAKCDGYETACKPLKPAAETAPQVKH